MPTPNVERDETWRPAGVPVSSTMRIEASGKVADVARESLDTIDRVHGVGFSSHITIPVVEGGSSTRPGGFEFYHGGRPVHIELSSRSATPHIDFTHEVGHFLDHQLIGSLGDYASRSGDAVLSGWKTAVEATAAYQRLSDLAEMKRVRVAQPNGGYRYVPVDRIYARYLLRPQELFARSYAQFIAVESGNTNLINELATLRKTREGAIRYPAQWADEDFAAIREQLLRGIMEMKWLK
jgi:hypothetical protein